MAYQPIKFPGWRYGPNGEAQIFEREEDVPEDWTNNPNVFKRTISAEKNEGAAGENPDSINTPEGVPAASLGENKLTIDEIKGELGKKSMKELLKMASELELAKGGKKVELIERIAQKLYENR